MNSRKGIRKELTGLKGKIRVYYQIHQGHGIRQKKEGKGLEI